MFERIKIKKQEGGIVDLSKKLPTITTEKGKPNSEKNNKGGFIKPPRPKIWG